MTATTNSSGCRSRRYSPIPPTCAPRLSWPRPNASTPGTAPRLRKSTGRRPHEMRRAVRAATLELIGATASSSAA